MADTVGLWIGTLPVGLQTGYKAFVGAEQIWPAPAWAQWGATSIYGILSNGDTSKAAAPGDASHAGFSIGTKPLSGKVYYEGECCSGFDPDAGTTGIGLATYAGGAIPVVGIGTLDTQLDMGSNSYRAALYSNFAQIGPDLTPHNTGTTYIYRFGVAYDSATRRAWVRQVYPGGPGPWILGGDPIAGTTPSYTMPGTDPVYIAGSVRGDTNAYMKIIANPVLWMNAGVTGFSPIDDGTRITVGNGLANANTGDAASGSYSVVGGTAPYTWRNDGDAVPGITFTADARSGTYTTAGTYTHYITVRDANGLVGQLRETIVVASSALTLTGTATTPIARGNNTTSDYYTVGGVYVLPVTFSIVGTLPPGMSLANAGGTPPSGQVYGAPTTTGSYTYQVKVTDSSPTPKTALSTSKTVVVNASTVTVGNGISGGQTGSTPTGSYTATGTYGGVTYTTTGTLPTGMTISSSGVRGGTFSAAGSYSFTVIATDAYGNTGSLAQTVVVSSIVVAGTVATPIRVGDVFSGSFTASGGTAPYSFTTPTGTVPPGFAMNSAGLRSGTSTTRGTYTWTTRATDAAAATGDKSNTVLVMANIVMSGGITSGQAAVPYTGSYAATGGTAPYTYSTTGTLPPGLAISSSGVRSGTPSSAGSGTFTVRATDANGDYQELPQTVTVSAASTGITKRASTTASNAAGVIGSTWTINMPTVVAGDLIVVAVHLNDLTGLGAPAGYSTLGSILSSTADGAMFAVFYKIAGGSEPTTISGASSTNSYADWVANAITYSGADPSAPFTSVSSVNPNSFSSTPLTLTFPTLTTTVDGTMLIAFEGADVNARGSAAPTVNTPTGYTLIDAIVSNGAVAQLSSFQKQQATAAAENLTNTIDIVAGESGSALGIFAGIQPPGPLKLSGTLTGTGHVGSAYSSVMTLSGNYVGPVTIGLATGALPPGLTWAVSGGNATLSGSPTTAGTYTFTPRATDSSGTPQVSTGASQSIVVTSGTVGIVQTKFAQTASSVSSMTITPTTPFTAGNKVICAVTRYSGTSISGVTINGTAATLLKTVSNGTTNESAIYMGTAGSGSAGCVITLAGSGIITASVIERDDINAVDVSAVANTTGTSFTATTAATAQAKETIVSVFVGQNNQNTAITPPTGWTLMHNQPNGFSSGPGAAAYKDVSATGTQAATYTTAASLAGSGVAVVAIKLN